MSKKVFIGLLSLSVIITVGVKAMMQSRSPRRVPYTIVWRALTADDAGNVREEYTETRYVSSSGNWHTIKQFADGRTEEGFAEVGRGVFAINPKKQKMFFLSEHDNGVISSQELQNSPQYSRTDSVLGHVAFVSKSSNDDNSIEVYRAPDLNGDLIKYVMQKDSTKRVLEPVSIIVGEPSAEKMRHDDFPSDNRVYDRTHVSPLN